MSSGARQIRAVTAGYTFGMETTKHTSFSNGKDIKRKHKNAINSYIQSMRDYISKGKDKADIQRRQDRVWTIANHKAAQAIAKEYNLKYTRKRTREMSEKSELAGNGMRSISSRVSQIMLDAKKVGPATQQIAETIAKKIRSKSNTT